MDMYFRVRFSNGEIFLIPAEFVAETRTKYYAEVDVFEKGSKEWDEEFKQSMKGYELEDWISNNMDWVDVKDVAFREGIDTPTYNYDKNWSGADIEVIGKSRNDIDSDSLGFTNPVVSDHGRKNY